MSEIPADEQAFYIETAKALKGSERRIFMAGVVRTLGRGGQRYAEKMFGWNRRTVRKGMEELTSGVRRIDQFSARGRKRAEERLPHLLDDLCKIVESHSQTGGGLGRERVMTRMSAAEVRRQLVEQKAYPEGLLPCVATISKKLNELGYPVRRAQESIHPKND